MLTAVVVTYNRKEELCKNLDMLYLQTIHLDKIIVVDNCSTDGTKEYLQKKGYLEQDNFIYHCTEENIGGAGGFYTGIQRAYNEKADWIIFGNYHGNSYGDIACIWSLYKT